MHIFDVKIYVFQSSVAFEACKNSAANLFGTRAMSEVSTTHFKILHELIKSRVPDLQMSCEVSTEIYRTVRVVPSMTARVTCPIDR